MARKTQTQTKPSSGVQQADVTFAQLLLVTRQIYGNCGTRKARS
jgi:hypothetical protein